MNARNAPKVTADSAPSPHPDPTPAGETGQKRAKPTASPEFVQARIRRDLRLLDERQKNLDTTYKEKTAKIAADREALVKELAVVDAKLASGGGG